MMPKPSRDRSGRPLLLFSLLAVFSGWITAVAIVVLARAMVEYPLLQISGLQAAQAVSVTVLWIRIGYGTVAGVIGGFVTARLAPRAPLRHVLALLVPMAGVAGLYLLVTAPTQPPLRNAAAFALPLLGALLGGWLQGRFGEG